MDLRAPNKELQKLDYENLTSEQIEEFVEFIDWSKVPIRFITDDVKNSFGAFPGLSLRVWFDDILSNLKPLKGYEEFIDGVCYRDIKEGNFLAEVDLKKNNLRLCNQKVLLKISRDSNCSYTSNVVEKYIRSVWKEHHVETNRKLIGINIIHESWDSMQEREGRINTQFFQELFYFCQQLKICIL